MSDIHLPVNVLELARFACDDPSRPAALGMIEIKTMGEGRVRAASTDGHVAALFSWQQPDIVENIYLKAKDVQKALKAVPKKARLEGGVWDRKGLALSGMPAIPIGTAFEGEYPDIEQIVPKEQLTLVGYEGEKFPRGAQVGFDLDLLIGAREYISACNHKHACMMFTLHDQDGPGRLDMDVYDALYGKFTFIIMPVRI